MNITEIVTVPVIVGLCYLIGFIITLFKNEKLNDFIPGILIIIGFALGLVTYFTIPGLMPANDWLTALFIGGASGWAATGANQFIKKLKSLLGKGE